MKLRIKKFDKSRIGTFCSFVLPLILLLQISLPGVALCFGSDGHVALENYYDGLCNEIISKSDSQDNNNSINRTINSSNNRHCNTCIDIPTTDNNTENKLISSNDVMPEIDIHQFVVYQLTSQMYLEASSQSFIVQELPTGNTFLDSIQTTIIIC